jgi:glycerate kinase
MSPLVSDEHLPRYNKGMKIICAPDSFKGSLSAAAAAAAMAAGALHAAPRLSVLRVPLADGGEGTVDALVGARGGATVSVDARDPLDRPIRAPIGLLGAEMVVVEMAAASGLPLLRPEERDPFRASTYGTGQLLRAALDRGAREIILGVGGSATVDGGAGALQALGARLLDATGAEIPGGNAGLARLHQVDLRGIDPRLAHVRLRIACDVRNPLTGPAGAAAVFGPQKGARPPDIEVLDANLARLAAVLRRDTGMDIASLPGSGAAGGLTAGLLAIGATTEPGIELILDATRFDALLADADLVITGEGRLDRQTAQGKVVSGVMAHAARQQVPVVALAGSVRGGEIGSLYTTGLVAAFSITDGPLSHAKAFGRAATLLRRSTEAVVRLWMAAAGQWQQRST